MLESAGHSRDGVLNNVFWSGRCWGSCAYKVPSQGRGHPSPPHRGEGLSSEVDGIALQSGEPCSHPPSAWEHCKLDL
jgi:hypothetical protein